MKTLNNYINEWKINNNSVSNIKIKSYHPKDTFELYIYINKIYKMNNKYLDLRNIDVSDISLFYLDSVTKGIFYDFNDVEIIDIRGWNTSNVRDMTEMFFNCYKLKEIRGIEDIDVSFVGSMKRMFCNCFSLESIDLSKWKLKTINTTEEMFDQCKNLKEVKGIENWENYSDFYDHVNTTCMFISCPKLYNYPSWYKYR